MIVIVFVDIVVDNIFVVIVIVAVIDAAIVISTWQCLQTET